jgi:hypothetical protein
MWVEPPSPAQPDSLGFGIDELGEGGPDECLRRHGRASQALPVAIVDDAGVPQRNRNLANDPANLLPVLGALAPGTPVAFEAAYGWGRLVELLEELELEPHLVHPSRCKAIASARLKNDKVDAATLAQLLLARLSMSPPVLSGRHPGAKASGWRAGSGAGRRHRQRQTAQRPRTTSA